MKKISLIVLTGILLTGICRADYKKGGFYSEARNGDIKAVKKLLTLEENQKPSRLNAALQAAVSGNHPKMISFLVKQGADPNLTSVGPSPLLINAIMYNYPEAAEALVRSGANVNTKGFNGQIRGFRINWHWTPLMCAAYKGYDKVVRALIRKKADIRAVGYSHDVNDPETAADIAAYSGHTKILRCLLRKKAQAAPRTIFKVIRGGHLDALKLLLKKGFSVNQTDENGRTLLIEAAWWGRKDILAYLIQKGADIDRQDNQGYTALSEAAGSDNDNIEDQKEIIKLLIAGGADINKADFFGMTPLMRAAQKKYAAVLQEALDARKPVSENKSFLSEKLFDNRSQTQGSDKEKID